MPRYRKILLDRYQQSD
uniref:Uncharacterized protein n=1 Tax=Romanomermis culicivorax TaxID=13658 RepID=A0A915JUB2_ROMCU